MSNSTLQLALEIALQTKNLTELDLLTDQLKAAGVDVTKLTEESGKLAKQFGELEQKQALINQFRELKKVTSEANVEWQTAQKATADYTAQIATAKDSLEALAVAMQNQGDMSQEEAKSTQAEYTAMVREIKNLEEAQAKQATKASQLKTQYEDLNNSLVDTRSAMNDVGLATIGLNAQQKALEEESRAAKESLAQLTAEAQSLNEIAQAKIVLGIDTDDNALAQIEEVTKAYETLRDSGVLTEEELARATQAHTARVAELEGQLEEAKPSLESIAEEFGKVTAAAGGLAYVTNEAMKFETAMAGVKKMVDGTPEQIQALADKIQAMSIQLGMGSDAIAEIAAQGGGLGIPIEKLGEFTEMAGKMAIAFNMTAEEAGDAAAKLANVFDIPITQVGALGDAINSLGNTTAAKESEIVDAMQRIGGNAKQFGLASEEAAALSATMIALGKTPEVAATAINALLTKLQTANVQSDDFQQTLSNIGISANQMAADINANPQQALSNFLQTLATMDKQQRSVATFKLFGQDYVDDVNVLVGALGSYNSALDTVKDKTSTAGAMQKEFEAKMATSDQAIARAKQTLSVLAQSIGKELLPVVAMGANAIGGMAQAVTDFSASHPLLTKAAVLIAGANVAMIALNSTIALAGGLGLTSFGRVAVSATTATTAINATTVATTRLNAVMGGVAGAAGGIATVATNLNKVSVGSDLAAGNVAKLATQALALSVAFDAGQGIGDWLYKNSSGVRTFGDELGRGLAYMDAMVTDRTFEDVKNNFETSAESASRLANQQKNVKQTAEEQATAQQKATNATKEQSAANIQLANDIKITTANLDGMKNKLAEMETGGKKNTTEYQNLSTEIGKTKDKLELLHAEANKKGIGELLKTDLEKASKSFEALGLDAEEFATGIDSKTNAALTAFVDIAHLAEGDTRKLALAYNAAKEAAGDNVQAQAELDAKLAQVTEGNKDLANAVKKTAEEQKNAKSTTEAQAEALDKLGISMEAANAGMSKGGKEMVDTLKTGITAIKEQATSADSLKTSLQQAFSQSINSAKTKADFEAISQAIKESGTASQLTAEQTKILQAGMQGGADSAKKAQEAIDAQTKALTDNSQATAQNVNNSQQFVNAKNQEAEASKKAAEAEKQAEAERAEAQKASTARLLAYTQGIMNWTKQPLQDLEALGVTAEQTKGAYEGLIKSMFPPSRLFADFNEWSVAMADVRRETEKASAEYRKNYEAVNNVTNALGEATANSDTLAQAQKILEDATNANTFALIKLDNEKLENLQKAIDDTKHKMDDFTESAKSAADNLEAELAKMDGDDSLARKIEQTRKLEEVQTKLNEARQRGNQAEIEQYQRALELQKKINDKENQQAQAKAEETKRREAETGQKAQAKSDTATTQTTVPATQTTQPIITTSHADYLAQPVSNVTANEVVSELMKKSVEVGKQAMLSEIRNEIKRQPF